MAKNRITLNGTEYPCRITFGAMLRFEEETGHDVSELDKLGIKGMGQFIYCCVKSASVADKEKFDMDFITFADHLDANSMKSFYKEMEASQKNLNSPVTSK